MPSTTSSPECPEACSLTVSDEARALNARLGSPFVDLELLQLALAHRSWCAENPGHDSNERLEFLGDAVLGLVVTDHLFREYSELPEGELAKIRASVVSAAALAEFAPEIGLGHAMLLGRGEDASGGREKPSILADALEAVIGALYISEGWAAARGLVLDLCLDRIVEAAQGPGGQDYKTRLQEMAAQRYDHLPDYTVVDEGPDHAKVFHARVRIGGADLGQGDGRSKKQAEQAAARDAWERLVAAATAESEAADMSPEDLPGASRATPPHTNPEGEFDA